MPFKPGQSGNPEKKFSKDNQPEKNGRPKKLPELDELIAEVLTDEQNGITAAKAILMKFRQQAIGGNIKAGEILLDRAWGKAKQSIEMTGPDGNALQPVININLVQPK